MHPDVTETFLGIEKDECEAPSVCGAAAVHYTVIPVVYDL